MADRSEPTIRAERPDDLRAIHAVVRAAFVDAEHSDHTEHELVDALRADGALTVSLVALEAAEVVGHVALSPVRIEPLEPSGWFGLGPIAVTPVRQGQGVGSALMRAALDELEARGASGCVLLGDPAYYTRFGFSPAAPLLLPGVPPDYFLVRCLQGDVPSGVVRYHRAFGVER